MDLVEDNEIEEKYKNFIVKQKHPCIMANAVFAMNKYHLKIYGKLSSAENTASVLKDIEAYIEHYDFDSNEFESLIFCFKYENIQTEEEFEEKLWQFLQRLHDNDTTAWDPRVSEDPNNSKFSFSLKGRAFYIVGMHPKSSRLARRAPYCTIVLNLHWQFEKLREMGTYQTIKKRIRQRDKRFQGTINPVLRDFGKDTEAKQYSGRAVENNWKCPFHQKTLES
ncbi:guanitoxin biosynthesis heme-dependent pre-guanitoxin N-hydroxylase GntA [Gelidibacter gilvus]|uniref:YqcI/YcgG family protein n=1 Tax=Gelidibacter gilvus TaxID=59602 RepID=A0A4Q0XC71_9FLAO|nr:guanitoxin biosynthesis heme-dependent pre-guanitoxin N-hydroxylase GntA [Gelidibacter gilvus]RXJ44314.1 YqcI/YcgG family protein [Gelidibacter gilvus]